MLFRSTADEAIRTARLGREVGLSDWVKIEVIGDKATLYPDIHATLEATRVLVAEGFTVLPYTAPAPEYQRKKLTDRERQVLQYVFEGLANKEIADRLQVSESSVKATLQQLFSKTGVRTRSQLVRTALENYKDQL